jgi:hypothetical protein
MKEVKKTSPLIFSQLPEFVREDHPLFVQFMEAYYEWLEKEKNATNVTKNLLNYKDIDHTLDEFLQFFKNKYLHSFPEEILADKQKLIKHIRQFYRAKGTEKSYKLLFNILFESPVDFYYPHRNLLRPSNGKWVEEKVLRVSSVSGNPFTLTSTTIFGKNTNTSAYVDEVKSIEIGPFLVYELYLNRSSILGSFNQNEMVTNGDVVVQNSVLFGGFDFEQSFGGFNYQIGDEIIIDGGSGFGAKAEVSSIGPNGEIQNVKIIDFGFNYQILPDPSEISVISENGVGAILVPKSSSLMELDGYWINDDGKLNSADRIQDGFFYQQFSYVIFVNQSLERYSQIVKDLLHPSGLLLFGGYRVDQFIEAQATLPDAYGKIKLILPKSPECDDDSPFLCPIGPTLTLPEKYLTHTLLQNSINSPENMFFSIDDMEIYKFKYAPSSLIPGAQASVAGGTNANYYDEFANTPMQHFENEVIGDWIGWDYVLVSYDPQIHTPQFLENNINNQILETQGSTEIRVKKFQLPKNTQKSGLMRLYFSYTLNNIINSSEQIWLKSNPMVNFNVATINPVGFEKGKISQLSIQSDLRFSNNPQAEIPMGHTW